MKDQPPILLSWSARPLCEVRSKSLWKLHSSSCLSSSYQCPQPNPEEKGFNQQKNSFQGITFQHLDSIFQNTIDGNVPHYKVSLTKPNVPIDDAINSSTRSVSFFCTCNILSKLDRSSGFSAITSACIFKNTFWNVSTASKSRCERRRCVRALRNSLRLSTDTRDLSSKSIAAGDRVLA